MELLIRFFESTICPITKPQGYHLFHILFCVLTIALFIVICYFSRKCSDKVFRIVISSLGVFLILTEIYKQLYFGLAYNYSDSGVTGIFYEWDIFPFQLCSVPMYLCTLVGFLRKGKLRDTICEYLVTVGFLGGIMAYLEPSGILHDDLFRLLHSCIWHALLIFIALFILFTNNANHRLKDYPKALIVYGGVVLIATTLNLSFFNKASEGFNMCYISPFRNTPLAVFKDVTVFLQNLFNNEYIGRIIVNIIYVGLIPVAGFLIYLASFYIKKGISKLKQKASI